MTADRRKRIRDTKYIEGLQAEAAEAGALRTSLALSEGLLSVSTERLAVLEPMEVEHDKCPRRIAALERSGVAKDAEITSLKAELAAEKATSAHWLEQHLARGVELGALQQEIGPLRNDAKSAEIARLRARLQSVQIELSNLKAAQ